MAEAKEKHAPIRQSVHVDCPIEDAFRLFTEEFAEWWPLASYSASGEDSEHCAIEPWVGGRVFERSRSGEERDWGSVTAWEPPKRVAFTWHPDRPRDDRESVEIEFRTEAYGTTVILTHHGWHLAGVETCALQAGYAAQWPVILLRFAELVSEQILVAV